MATINVLDSVGATVAIEKPLAPGRASAASSRPIALSAEDFAVLDGLEAAIAALPQDNVIAAGTATVGAIVPVPKATASGATSSRINAAASTNATSLKGSAGNVVNLDVFNVAAYDVFLKFYNKATAPTVGTDTPVWTIPIKAGTGYSRTFDLGKSFATGIAYAITKLQADSDTTVVVALDLTGSIDWI